MPNQLQKRVHTRQKAQPKPALARIFNAACACLCAQSSTIKDCKQALKGCLKTCVSLYSSHLRRQVPSSKHRFDVAKPSCLLKLTDVLLKIIQCRIPQNGSLASDWAPACAGATHYLVSLNWIMYLCLYFYLCAYFQLVAEATHLLFRLPEK